jgi:hypothetical protein
MTFDPELAGCVPIVRDSRVPGHGHYHGRRRHVPRRVLATCTTSRQRVVPFSRDLTSNSVSLLDTAGDDAAFDEIEPRSGGQRPAQELGSCCDRGA